MAEQLRIFISSTMEDLANERAMVAAKIREFNFKPVNAEAMLPNGATSWGKITDELETCHLFILILGERYGWIPTIGPLADMKVSVTHEEYLRARELKIPVLPFYKRLSYSTSARDTDDAKLRDKFREMVGNWEGGEFRAEFNLGMDLSKLVGESLTELLSSEFQRSRVQARRAEAATPPAAPAAPPPVVSLPVELVRGVRAHEVVLFAGSGISLAAGLPASAAFAAALTGAMGATYSAPVVGAGFASIAGDFVLMLGRDALVERVRNLLELPGATAPTEAHQTAAALFPKIVTTNYDQLFEKAVDAKKSGQRMILGAHCDGTLPEKFLLKLHGSYTDPGSLVMTDIDLAVFETTHERVLKALSSLLCASPVLVVGTSLRDPSVFRLFMDVFERSGRKELGYCLIGAADPLAKKRIESMGLKTIEGDIGSFFSALAKSVS
jgi:Domain of unknown function (DUF4062)/SIR2-like domain